MATSGPGKGATELERAEFRNVAGHFAASGWDKTALAPALPQVIVEQTRAKYIEAYERIVGKPFNKWLEAVAV